MPVLFICHTAYQVLIALCRAVRQNQSNAQKADIVLSAAIPDAGALAARLTHCGAFATATVVDESLWPGTVSGLFAAQRNKKAFERRCGWRLVRGRYSAVYISNDWSALGRYLQDCRTGYILCEDTLGGTLDPDQHLLDAQRAAPQGRYLYWGDSAACAKIESEDAAQCRIFPPEKLVTFSKAALLAGLQEPEKAAVRAVFLRTPLPQNAENATLLLPRSFVLDGLMEQAAQDAMFQAVAAQYADGPLFIKTHPRDETNYHELFPTATVLDKSMPSEVLNFCLPFKFRRAVTVQSWVLRGFTAAQQNIFLSLEQAQQLTKS